MDLLNNYFSTENVHLHGRFGKFEYLNMDAVIEHSIELAKLI
jgi:UDP-galactopyranose mutase